jgi:hypothetical protein
MRTIAADPTQDDELYVLARSGARRDKEQARAPLPASAGLGSALRALM